MYSNGTQIATYSYTTSNNNKTATNNVSITLNDITGNTTVYVTYSYSTMWGGSTTYQSPNFTIEQAVNEGVTLQMTQKQ